MQAPVAIEPTPNAPPLSARDASIDALRGLCLLGIALVNVPWIGAERAMLAYLFDPELRAVTPVWDLGAAALVEWLGEGKFYPQFSMLFGFGAGLLLSRGALPYARRIFVLAAFGLIHSALGWWGDILLDYAAIGILLALLSRAPRAWIAVAAVALFFAAWTFSYLFDDWATTEQDWAEAREYAAHAHRLYAQGSFWEITKERFTDSVIHFFSKWEWGYRTNAAAMACFGLWVQKRGLVERPAERRGALGKLGAVLCVVGLGIAIVPYTYVPAGDMLAIGYACVFLWLANGPRGSSLVRWLAPLGRCAISGYLGQTIAFTLVFYSYGLGLYGRLSPLACVALAAAVWAAEVLIARAWMARFSLGPVEWLWRSLTHLRWLPIRS